MAYAPTQTQVPDNSILDNNNKQIYLGNQYSVNGSFTVGTTEIPLILLTNNQPAPSPQRTTSKSLFQNRIVGSDTSATGNLTFKVYLNPTVTSAGTVLTPINMRPSQGVSNSKGSPTSAPTVSSNGTLVDSFSAVSFAAGMNTLLKILDPGQSVLITAIASAVGSSATVIVQWYEL